MNDKKINKLTKDDLKYLENYINTIDENKKVFNTTIEIIEEKKKIMTYKEDLKSNKIKS